MDAERIERLAIDRALGELNEDVAALFEVSLTEHPEMQALANDMATICMQTKAALSDKASKQSTNSISRNRPRPSRILWRSFGRWAAIVAVSISLGVTIGRWRQPSIPSSSAPTISYRDSGNRQEILDSQNDGFWQSKALALLQTTPYARNDSHDSQTSLWGRYRQLRKEHSNE